MRESIIKCRIRNRIFFTGFEYKKGAQTADGKIPFFDCFYKKGWLKTVSFTYNKQDCFDIEKGRNKRKVTGYRKCESLSF
mgnify:FL=1